MMLWPLFSIKLSLGLLSPSSSNSCFHFLLQISFPCILWSSYSCLSCLLLQPQTLQYWLTVCRICRTTSTVRWSTSRCLCSTGSTQQRLRCSRWPSGLWFVLHSMLHVPSCSWHCTNGKGEALHFFRLSLMLCTTLLVVSWTICLSPVSHRQDYETYETAKILTKVAA